MQIKEFIAMLHSGGYEQVADTPGELPKEQKMFMLVDDGDAYAIKLSCGVFLFTHGGAFIGHLDP